MIPLSLLPWRKIIPALAILAVLGAVIGWHVHRVDLARSQGHEAGAAEIQSQWDKATIAEQDYAARLSAERRKLEQQREKDQRTEVENAQERLRLALRDRADIDGLRRDADARAARRCPASSNPPAAIGSAPAADPGLLFPELLARLGEAGAELASEADRRGIAGAACVALYDSLGR